ncbi:transposase (plasmid) [Sinorhizobium kummerowiae]|nr:transposase [Sinorhizobium kummerowiae]WQH40993.1 transposase [Sinorhizobium kummerowiae]
MSGMSEAAKRGRRNWSLEDKWRIVEEAQLPGNSVAEVARRRGVNSNLLFEMGLGAVFITGAWRDRRATPCR